MSDWDVIGLGQDGDENDEDEIEDIIIDNEFTDSILSGSLGETYSHESSKNGFNTDKNSPFPQYYNSPHRRRDRGGRNHFPAGDLSADSAKAFLEDEGHHSYTPHALFEVMNENGAHPTGSKRRNSMRRGDKRNVVPSSNSLHKFNHVSKDLLQEGRFVQSKYDRFRAIGIGERAARGIGLSSEMNSLFYFWCYYLRTHFNETMYNEFLEFARQDNEAGSHYGLECFFRMCSYGLEINWNEHVFEDFQREAIEDYNRGNNYGLDKMKGFLANQKLDIEIPMSQELKNLLEKYPTFESLKNGTEKPQPYKIQKGRNGRQYAAGGKSMPRASAMMEVSSAPKKDPFAEGAVEESPLSDNKKDDQQESLQKSPRDKQFTRQRARGRRRNGQGFSWEFGTKVQPSSAPIESLMKKKW